MKLRIFAAFFLGVAALVLLGAKITSDTLRLGNKTAEDITIVFDIGNGANNPQIKWDDASETLQFSVDGTNFAIFGSGTGGAGGENLLKLENWNFEDGDQKWTGTGSSSFAITEAAAVKGFDGKSGLWDASATGEYLTSESVPMQNANALKGNGCLVHTWYLWDSGVQGDLKLQFFDGTNVLSQVEFEPTNGTWKEIWTPAIQCPQSGSVQVRIASFADAAEITLDNVHIGENIKVGYVSQAIFWGRHTVENDAACSWGNGGDVWTQFTPDPDCSDRNNYGKVLSPDTEIPGFKTDVIEGTYQISVNGFAFAGSGTQCSYTIYDGTSYRGFGFVNTALNNPFPITASFEYGAGDIGTKTFQIVFQRQTGSDSCFISTTQDDVELVFEVTYFPSGSQVASTVRTTPFLIQGNIGGTNISLGTSNQASYVPITNGSIDMTLQNGTAEIPCTTGESSGLTCSAGDEVVGVSWYPDSVGFYEICFNLDVRVLMGTSDAWDGTLQIVESANDDETSILYESKVYGHSYLGTSSVAGADMSAPFRLCHDFPVTSLGKKTHNVMYEQNLTGPPSSISVIANRGAATGQSEISFRIRKSSQQFPNPFVKPDEWYWNYQVTDTDIDTTEVELESYTIQNSGLFDVLATVHFSNARQELSTSRWNVVRIRKTACTTGTQLVNYQSAVIHSVSGVESQTVNAPWLGELVAGDVLKVCAYASLASVVKAYEHSLKVIQVGY